MSEEMLPFCAEDILLVLVVLVLLEEGIITLVVVNMMVEVVVLLPRTKIVMIVMAIVIASPSLRGCGRGRDCLKYCLQKREPEPLMVSRR